jgi:hypothetical protein
VCMHQLEIGEIMGTWHVRPRPGFGQIFLGHRTHARSLSKLKFLLAVTYCYCYQAAHSSALFRIGNASEMQPSEWNRGVAPELWALDSVMQPSEWNRGVAPELWALDSVCPCSD